MNRWIQHKVLRAKYRKYALRISAVIHVIMLILLLLFFIKTEIQEAEDEIAVELFTELPRQIVEKKPTPIKEPEMPELEEITLQRKEIALQKVVNVVQHKHTLEMADMPASAETVEIQQPSSQNIDVDTSVIETPDLLTDARLEPIPNSPLSPNVTGRAEDINKASSTRRGNTGIRSPTDRIKKGLAQRTDKKGTGKKNGTGTGGSGTGGTGNGSDTFSSIIGQLTDDIIASSSGRPIDVVFVVDASGSMQDNINAVTQHLGEMIDVYEKAQTDYHLGLTSFYATKPNNGSNVIRVYPLTTKLSAYKQKLDAIRAIGGWQNAPDAIHQTVKEMRFRPNSAKHFILVTDEPFTSAYGYSVYDTIRLCKRSNIYAHVLGNDIPNHKLLAAQTGGTWHAVPQDPRQQSWQTAQIRTAPPRIITPPRIISNFILKDARNIPNPAHSHRVRLDIILFIDGSKSMESKTAYIKEQIDLWIRDWDNANINYRLGVVRFRAKQGVNIVNVFKPPQTQKQIHSILQLPYQADENGHQAVVEGMRRLKLRPNVKRHYVKTHFILITDEPGNPKQPIAGTIALLKDMSVTVHVLGATDTFQQQVATQTKGVFVKMRNAHTQNSPNQ